MAAYSISLADLRLDIAGAIPTDLVLRWNETDRSAEQHARLLGPYRASGTIVSADAAGLSRLTQQLTLPQVMKVVSEPKELLHAYGKAIGGEAIGVWAADNSQMFYPSSVEPSGVVEQMLAVQAEGKARMVKIGIGIHFGECFKVAGGLFGPDADFIEAIAEDDTRGGEIVVSGAVHERLGGALRAAATVRADLSRHGELWSIVDYRGPLAAAAGGDDRYPTPFDEAFFQRLRGTSIDELGSQSFDEFRELTTVAFIKVHRAPRPLLLDTFTEMSLVDLSIRRVASAYRSEVVKSTGALAIVLFEDDGEAVSFARDVIETNRTLGLDARVGLVKGEVFLLPLAGGGREIAGNPVNVASKLSEDAGLDGVLVESSVASGDAAWQGEPFQLDISGIQITGRRIEV